MAKSTKEESTVITEVQVAGIESKRLTMKTILRFINPLAARTAPPVPDAPYVTGEASADIFSKMYFIWMDRLMITGYARELKENDIPLVDPKKQTKVMTEKFVAALERRIAKGQKKNLALRALYDTFKAEIWWVMITRSVVDAMWMTSPQLTRRIIYFVNDAYKGSHAPISHGIGMVVGLGVILAVSSILQQQFMYHSHYIGAQARGVLVNALYQKSLALSNRARVDHTNGKIASLMSTDTYRVEFACQFVGHLLDAPIPLIICLIMLVINIGPSSLCGFALIVLATPVLTKIAKIIARRRVKSTIFTDARIRLTQELLQSIRVIKFFAWENAYIKRLLEIRRKEIKLVRFMLVLRSGIFAISLTLPVFASMISFVVLSVTGGNLDPARVFASLSLFNLLRIPLIVLPLGLTTGIDAYVALNRIQLMLTADELSTEVAPDTDMPEAILVRNASFTWEEELADSTEDTNDKTVVEKKIAEDKAESVLSRLTTVDSARMVGVVPDEDEMPDIIEVVEKPFFQEGEIKDRDALSHFSGLHNLNFSIKRGEFIVITGFIGSGKTSLLASMVGEMRQTSGVIKIGGSVAYCPQPWIQNSTLMDNILFGRPYDEERYNRVIKDCALERDLKVLPDGDQTEIGERGINISGGQKSRITLARAAYYDAEIVLLDDVLSAVDSHVGRHLVEQCICGLLDGKTRLLATHQLHVLPHADRIIFMDGVGGLTIGTYDELLLSCPKFAQLITFGSAQKSDEEEDEEEEEEEEEKKVESEENTNPESLDAPKKVQQAQKLMKVEEHQQDNVSWEVYKVYFKEAGGKYFSWSVAPLVVFVAVIAAGLQILANLWLSYWTQDRFHMARGGYIGVFVMLGVVCALFYFFLGLVTTYAGANASVKMNISASRKVLRAPMSFFDTSPLGRIINRFSSDVESMDNTLIDAYRMALITVTNIGGILILIVAYFYWFALALVPLMFLFCHATAYYRASAVGIKRMDSNARSVVFSHFGETLTGLTSVRAYHEQNRFKAKMEAALDYSNRFGFMIVSNQRWLSIRLESLAILLTFVSGILAICARLNVSPASIGLVMSYCTTLSFQMAMVIKQVADVENHMNATERVYYYMKNLPSEAPLEIEETTPRESWPEKGAIEMKNVVMQYRPGLPNVLRGLTLSIKGGEKIGICGRTGAGKSSIMVALYRLAELSGGSIEIDGVDISKIGLHDLRKKLAIIPQDPVLFKGTIRSNLDPFDSYSDVELWDALRRSDLLSSAYSTPDDSASSSYDSTMEEKQGACETTAEAGFGKFSLDQPVDDEGSNFSLGERQLLSLARALVRTFQILVLDEATSSVDYQTDAKIQNVIVREFSKCTILCIAHRLKTIITYDKILVLDNGQVAEFEEPKKLFDKKDSIFRALCLKSRITDDDFMTK
ncbi:P-loop containing nucleoside triphosphate hydrolase protein [Lipomyces arxii]|uniref:P-loop containing nucleoside triphosphate hydrolase protein n=1 Tax=Lipomyces arxii TaxID=56418 RepID=UPI0034CF45A6